MKSKICRGCEAEIITIPSTLPNWMVVVHPPQGSPVISGPFCMGCMLFLGQRGVLLHHANQHESQPG